LIAKIFFSFFPFWDVKNGYSVIDIEHSFIDTSLMVFQTNVEHTERFYKEFGDGYGKDSDDKGETSNNVHDGDNSEPHKPSKPADFQALFGGNNNDHFMIGIKFTRSNMFLALIILV
jgi:hypothetical protein